MKRIKNVTIMGKKCHITYSSQVGGGSAEIASGNIIIGTASKTDVQETLLHECSELILCWMGLRYDRYEDGNDGVRFILSHREFERFVQELSAVLEQMNNDR